MTPALVLSFLSGYIALSYEILWYRAYSFMSGGVAPSFGLMLGMYLLGIAAGSTAAGRLCAPVGRGTKTEPTALLARFILLSNLLGYLLMPGVAWMLSTFYHTPWTWTLPLVAVASCGLGATFPLISHLAVPADDRAGARVSHIYFANILGSTAGSLGTGFWLLDHCSLASASRLLALLGLAMGAALLGMGAPSRRSRALRLLAAGAVGSLLLLLHPLLYGAIYERLQFKFHYRSGSRFAHVVENKSGVITVSADGTVFGGGWYDGSVNTSLDRDRNGILRAYALSALHPAPREVLMIGLSSGSWASVVAENPAVERLTIVEINPGYLQVIPRFPEVAGVLSHPKVRIEIDDARRWLLRNREREFDVIISNTTVNWRAHVTGILSAEFIQLAKSRLRDGGLLFYQTTNSLRAALTGISGFSHALSVQGFLAVSDSPIVFEADRWMEVMKRHPRQGRPLFSPDDPGAMHRLAWLSQGLKAATETRESMLSRMKGATVLTDDNMGTEWSEYPIR